MKKIKFIALLFLSLACFTACIEDDSITYVAEPSGDLTFSNDFLPMYVLSPSAASNIGERFTWDDANFDIQTNVNYELQKSIIGDFTDMEVVGTTTENAYTVTIGNLLTYAGEAGLDNDPATEDMPDTGNVYFRLKASVGTEASMEILSEAQTLTLFLPPADDEETPELKHLFLVGDATAEGWNNIGNNPALIRDPSNTNQFVYKGFFVGGGEGFKLLEVLGQWQPQWGMGANTGEAAVNEGGGTDPAAFTIATDGYYSFSIDIEAMTYTLEDYDASSAPTYPTIGIIGDATPGGWDNDTDLTQSSFDPHIWYINGIELIDGFAKFRAADDWAVNWGADTELSGFGLQNGPDVPVIAGTYNVWFNDLDGGYILVPVE